MKTIDFTQENLQKLKQLESESYKDTSLAMMQSCDTWEDIADYCECELSELKVYLFEDWYVILAEHEDYIEFVDLASKTKHTPLFKVLDIVKPFDKIFCVDCRESTSYRIVQAMEKAGRLEVKEDTAYERDDEIFHEMVLNLTPRQERNYTQSLAH